MQVALRWLDFFQRRSQTWNNAPFMDQTRITQHMVNKKNLKTGRYIFKHKPCIFVFEMTKRANLKIWGGKNDRGSPNDHSRSCFWKISPQWLTFQVSDLDEWNTKLWGKSAINKRWGGVQFSRRSSYKFLMYLILMLQYLLLLSPKVFLYLRLQQQTHGN